MLDPLWPHGLEPTRLLCPWNSPGKNTGVGCHFLLLGVFLTQGSNPLLLRPLHWQVDSLPLAPLGKALSILTLLLSHEHTVAFSKGYLTCEHTISLTANRTTDLCIFVFQMFLDF